MRETLEIESIKETHPDIYSELLKQFKGNSEVCNNWFVKPKPALGGKSPLEQLTIDSNEVMGLLVRMRTGDFS